MQIFDAAVAGNILAETRGNPEGAKGEAGMGGAWGGLIRLAIAFVVVGAITFAVDWLGGGKAAGAILADAAGTPDRVACID